MTDQMPLDLHDRDFETLERHPMRPAAGPISNDEYFGASPGGITNSHCEGFLHRFSAHFTGTRSRQAHSGHFATVTPTEIQRDLLGWTEYELPSGMAKNGKNATEVIEAMTVGDFDLLETLVAEDVHWHFPQSAGERALLTSRTALVGSVRSALSNYYRELSPAFHHVVEDEERVAVLCTLTGRTHHDLPYENLYVYYFRFVDELVVEAWELLDTAYAYQVFGRR